MLRRPAIRPAGSRLGRALQAILANFIPGYHSPPAPPARQLIISIVTPPGLAKKFGRPRHRSPGTGPGGQSGRFSARPAQSVMIAPSGFQQFGPPPGILLGLGWAAGPPGALTRDQSGQFGLGSWVFAGPAGRPPGPGATPLPGRLGRAFVPGGPFQHRQPGHTGHSLRPGRAIRLGWATPALRWPLFRHLAFLAFIGRNRQPALSAIPGGFAYATRPFGCHLLPFAADPFATSSSSQHSR